MSKMTTDVGPPRDRGMLERMRARVKAVATSPSFCGTKGGADATRASRSARCAHPDRPVPHLHALCGPRGEEGQHEGEAGDEELGQSVDDGELLEDDGGVVEGRQEGHVLVADLESVVHKQVRESIREFGPADVAQAHCEKSRAAVDRLRTGACSARRRRRPRLTRRGQGSYLPRQPLRLWSVEEHALLAQGHREVLHVDIHPRRACSEGQGSRWRRERRNARDAHVSARATPRRTGRPAWRIGDGARKPSWVIPRQDGRAARGRRRLLWIGGPTRHPRGRGRALPASSGSPSCDESETVLLRRDGGQKRTEELTQRGGQHSPRKCMRPSHKPRESDGRDHTHSLP